MTISVAVALTFRPRPAATFVRRRRWYGIRRLGPLALAATVFVVPALLRLRLLRSLLLRTRPTLLLLLRTRPALLLLLLARPALLLPLEPVFTLLAAALLGTLL